MESLTLILSTSPLHPDAAFVDQAWRNATSILTSLPSKSLRRLQIVLHAHSKSTGGKAHTNADESTLNISDKASLDPFALAVERFEGAEVNVIRLSDGLSAETAQELSDISGGRFQLSADAWI